MTMVTLSAVNERYCRCSFFCGLSLVLAFPLSLVTLLLYLVVIGYCVDSTLDYNTNASTPRRAMAGRRTCTDLCT